MGNVKSLPIPKHDVKIDVVLLRNGIFLMFAGTLVKNRTLLFYWIFRKKNQSLSLLIVYRNRLELEI